VSRHSFLPWICALVLALVCVVPVRGWSGGMVMEPAKTRVGMAKIKLHVSDLHRTAEDTLEGIYELRIPLAPWMNDRGEIRLSAPGSLDQEMVDGGRLNGSGRSVLDGRTHPIVCRFGPGGTVEIEITTPERNLAFQTNYALH
jgi:hypothetical protein